MFDASQTGNPGKNGYARRNPSAFINDSQKFNQRQAQEHMTMEQMASDTGGHAFYNTNGLSDAVAKALDAGSNFYTLAYTPTDRTWNGSYRNLHVELTGTAAASGAKLEYRHGYYADDPHRPPKKGELPTTATPTPGSLADHAAGGVFPRRAEPRCTGAPLTSFSRCAFFR